MSAYRFVGAHCEIGGRGIKLERFGQPVELPDDLVEDVVRGGGAIIPEDAWQSLGISEADLGQLSHAGYRLRAPEALLEKFNAAQELYRLRVSEGIRPAAPAQPPAPGGNQKGQVK